ncbi:hypothetical protein BJ742DRAFT_684778 [Cladochytrium replicatum]|nr:hypothetical protein BJ742DRAFT_684778 [Cladochytrium replicatum]
MYGALQIPDLSGKTAIVTGGNTGIGLETVRLLASKNAKVYLAARSPERAKEAIDDVRAGLPGAKVEFMYLDLADMKMTKDAATRFVESGEPLDILINNAGVATAPFELTKDGIEKMFAIDHMGHFVFTTTLLPALRRAANSRVVNVSSYIHKMCPSEGIMFDRLNDQNAALPPLRYGQAKLANILFTKSLAEKVKDEKISVNAVNPGDVNTGILRGVDVLLTDRTWRNSILRPIWAFYLWSYSFVAMTPAKGALTQVYVATSPEIETKDYRGQYFVPFGKVAQPSPLARNSELAEKLWKFSENLVEEKLGGV